MFWKKRATVDSDTQSWMIDCWRWLDATIPARGGITRYPFIVPGRSSFPDTDKSGHEKAVHYFNLVLKYSGMTDWPCTLVAQDERPDLGNSIVFGGGVAATGPLGTFEPTGNAAVISYDPGQLNEPIQLIATFAHELAHYLLAATGSNPPDGEEMAEYATDVATVHMGFGLFGANTAFNFHQYTDFDRQGWSTSGAGYLSEAEWSFANAIYFELKGIDAALYRSYVKATIGSQIAKNRAYLQANPRIVEALLSNAEEPSWDVITP